ncbi:uncharacterized protein C19orf47 homolog isoform X2 [Ambystoma mexicanum]|uniref:uncharacterized protein C19orf47 homolog isoform X2 n=1 Tax=Ambystoma mexicanum TaxID=8296 RepID=UPI0037E84E0A
MASVTLATSEWIHFFKEAGIPPGPAVNYAVMFVDNRIQKNMLMDLDKEIMNELGITIVGDIIAILKHAKIVYRQDVCKAVTECVSPNHQSNQQSDLRRNAHSPATRMIANSLCRDSPPGTPTRRPDTSTSKISVTVSNKAAVKNAKAALPDEGAETPVKRRRVTAEMEGKYVINMPKGMQRTSVFDRLGAEAKADTTTGAKPTGVFSRLSDSAEDDKATESDDDCSILQYAGVLKNAVKPATKETPKPGVTIKAKATSSVPKSAITSLRRPTAKTEPSTPPPAKTAKVTPASKVSVIQRLGTPATPAMAQRLGKPPLPPMAQRLGKSPALAQDSKISSSKGKSAPEFRVTIKRTLGSPKVSSTSELHSAKMDNTGTVSVFKRLGRKRN